MLAIVNDDLVDISKLQTSRHQLCRYHDSSRYGDKEEGILGFCIFIERRKHDQIGTLSDLKRGDLCRFFMVLAYSSCLLINTW